MFIFFLNQTDIIIIFFFTFKDKIIEFWNKNFVSLTCISYLYIFSAVLN